MSNEAPAIDWAADVRRYVPNAENGVIAGIVNYCLIALKTRAAPLVSFGDPSETRRVRENFCKKTLGLTETDDEIDAAIAAVGNRMSDTTSRHRVTAYYLLAEHFGKLEMFSKAAVSEVGAPVAKLAAAVRGAYVARAAPGGSDGFIGFALLVGGVAAGLMLFAVIAGSFIGGRFDKAPPAPAEAPAPAAAVAEPAAPAIPEGAGVIFELVDGKPKESVYFDVGQSALAADFAEVSAPFKAWVDGNPDDRIAVSGFSDPSGDAEANAALSKARAEAVAQGLVALGVPADRIDLVKPADTSDATVTPAEARRVEITVTGS